MPTIAAVNGAAVGAGLCFALACDLVYAAEDAKLLAPFTSLGLHPGMAATYLLPQGRGGGGGQGDAADRADDARAPRRRRQGW